MSGEIEVDKCDVCGEIAEVQRTYFDYAISCECHNNHHFEVVKHCSKCVPKVPTHIHPLIKAMDGKSYRTTMLNILPIQIYGEFIIDEPIFKED